MVGQIVIGFVDARGFLGLVAHVHHQAQQITTGVLAHGLAQVQTNTVVDGVDLFVAVALNGQATQQHKAHAVFQRIRMLFQLGTEGLGQREVCLRKVGEVQALRLQVRQCGINGGNGCGREVVNPGGVAGQIFAAPCSGAGQRGLKNGAHDAVR